LQIFSGFKGKRHRIASPKIARFKEEGEKQAQRRETQVQQLTDECNKIIDAMMMN
jgi:hypothetical protein